METGKPARAPALTPRRRRRLVGHRDSGQKQAEIECGTEEMLDVLGQVEGPVVLASA